MIARLRGHVAETGEDWAILDVGGVGYEVHCSPRTLQNLPLAPEAVTLHVETQMREDSITLYGFLEPVERRWFRLLQSIQGVGARTALAVLGVLTPDQLATAIAAQDKAPLTRASGVGSRLAARIVAELKDRIGALPLKAPVLAASSLAATPAPAGGVAEDAISALVHLGYGRSDAYAAVLRVQALLGAEAGIDQLIRAGLKELSR